MKILSCSKCGAKVEIINDCKCDGCGIICCGKPMIEQKENSVNCAAEKHIPVYEKVGAYVVVTVPHVMEQEHYIECIVFESAKINAKKYFMPGEMPKAVFPYVKGGKISSICNKHGIWSAIVE